MTIGELMQAERNNRNSSNARVLVRVNGRPLDDYEEESFEQENLNDKEPAECLVCPMRNSRRCGNCPVS